MSSILSVNTHCRSLIHVKYLIELVFKDQFISRRDMMKLNRSLINTTVYNGRMLQDEGHSLRIQTLIIKNATAITGIITKNTKIIYRSLSAKYHILVLHNLIILGLMFWDRWNYQSKCASLIYAEKCLSKRRLRQ